MCGSICFDEDHCLIKRHGQLMSVHMINWFSVIVNLYFFCFFPPSALFDKKGLRWFFFRGELLQHSSLMAGHQYKIANYFAANSFLPSAYV